MAAHVRTGKIKKASKNMEVKNIDYDNYLIKFNGTEGRFLNELALTAHCKVEKIIADLMFIAILHAHEKLEFDQMMKKHDEYWDV